MEEEGGGGNGLVEYGCGGGDEGEARNILTWGGHRLRDATRDAHRRSGGPWPRGRPMDAALSAGDATRACRSEIGTRWIDRSDNASHACVCLRRIWAAGLGDVPPNRMH